MKVESEIADEEREADEVMFSRFSVGDLVQVIYTIVHLDIHSFDSELYCVQGRYVDGVWYRCEILEVTNVTDSLDVR
jgi:hypothetical protein